MLKNATNELSDNPFAALAMGLVTNMVVGLVDSLITPSGLANVMEAKKTIKENTYGETADKKPKREDLFKNSRTKFNSMSKFSIYLPSDDGSETRFILRREGLSWKLVNIIMPLERMAKEIPQKRRENLSFKSTEGLEA